MKSPSRPRPCIVPDCTKGAAYAFLAVNGDQALKLTKPNGGRIRACAAHLDHVVRKCAEMVEGSVRAVPLGVAPVLPMPKLPALP
jgi:hypothetical protein